MRLDSRGSISADAYHKCCRVRKDTLGLHFQMQNYGISINTSLRTARIFQHVFTCMYNRRPSILEDDQAL